MRKKVVTIGGGSGSFNLLRGLKKYATRHDEDESIDIKFIGAATDSGGSSGKLRYEYGILPPGDIRQGLTALSDESEFLIKLFEYRYDNEDSSVNGHSLGNLMMVAATKIAGNEIKGLDAMHRILKVRGRVMPSTCKETHIEGRYEDGTVLDKEHIIDKFPNPKGKIIEKLYTKELIKANPEALDVILSADAIVIGPGDLYTSIICNFLAEGLTDAIKKSKAVRIYNCNIMTKPSETPNYSVADHFNDLEKYLGKGIIDVVTYNNNFNFDVVLSENYKRENKYPVKFNEEEFKGNKVKIIGADLVSEHDIIRHDSKKISKLMMDLIFP